MFFSNSWEIIAYLLFATIGLIVFFIVFKLIPKPINK